MSCIDQIDAEAFDVCWARGDNDPKVFVMKDSAGAVIDISGWTMSMAVNTERNPADTTNEIFRVGGAFVTDGTNGEISFTPPANSLDDVEAPSIAYYDVQRVSPSIKTVVKGKVNFIMDIDKA